MRWNILSTFLLSVCVISQSDAVPKILVPPHDQRVPLNSTLRLQCRVSVSHGMKMHWLKDEFGIGGTRKDIRTYSSNRYDLPGNLNDGHFDLQITNVQLKDDGQYQCQVIAGGEATMSTKANVYVLVPSDKPVLYQIEPYVRDSKVSLKKRAWVEDGRRLRLKCTAKNGRPGAKLRWLIDGAVVVPDSNGKFEHDAITGTILTYAEKSETDEENLVDSVTTISAIISKLHNDKEIACAADNEGYETLPLPPVKTRLEVRYKPQVRITIEPARPNNEYQEHETIKVRCHADGRPPRFHWQWKMIQAGRVRDLTTIVEPWYRVTVTRDLHGTSFRCIAMNYASGSADTKIRVLYPPVFKLSSGLMYPAKEGETVNMACEVQSNPPSVVTWRLEGSDEVLQRGQRYTVYHVRSSNFGTYICTARAASFPPISKKIYLERKTKPTIVVNPLVHAREDASVKIKCMIRAIPIPEKDKIVWFKNKIPIHKDNRHSFTEEKFLRGVTSVLHITKVESSHFGDYNCSASNAFGGDWKIINLSPAARESRGYEVPIAFISGAAIAVVLTIVIMIVILFLCRRNNRRRQYYNKAQSMPNAALHLSPEHPVGGSIHSSTRPCSPAQSHSLYQWVNGSDPASSYIRYDFDDRSSVARNGSLLRFKPVEMNNSTSDKLMVNLDEEEVYKEECKLWQTRLSQYFNSTSDSFPHPRSTRSFDSGYSPGPTMLANQHQVQHLPPHLQQQMLLQHQQRQQSPHPLPGHGAMLPPPPQLTNLHVPHLQASAQQQQQQAPPPSAPNAQQGQSPGGPAVGDGSHTNPANTSTFSVSSSTLSRRSSLAQAQSSPQGTPPPQVQLSQATNV